MEPRPVNRRALTGHEATCFAHMDQPYAEIEKSDITWYAFHLRSIQLHKNKDLSACLALVSLTAETYHEALLGKQFLTDFLKIPISC